jgi:hypothetical protein
MGFSLVAACRAAKLKRLRESRQAAIDGGDFQQTLRAYWDEFDRVTLYGDGNTPLPTCEHRFVQWVCKMDADEKPSQLASQCAVCGVVLV